MARTATALVLALTLACILPAVLAGCKKRRAIVPESERFFNHQPLEALSYGELPAKFSWKEKNLLAPSWNQHIVSWAAASTPVRRERPHWLSLAENATN